MSQFHKQADGKWLETAVRYNNVPMNAGQVYEVSNTKYWVKESMAKSYGDHRVAEKWHWQLPRGALVTHQGW